MANHLWQSTLFAAAAGLLALALRRNRANVRHWIWLTASVKFLLPFSLLAGLGAIQSPGVPRTLREAQISFALQEAGAPFPAKEGAPTTATQGADWDGRLANWWLAIWVSGSAAAVWRWLARWRRLQGIERDSRPLALDVGVRVKTSPELLEPGVFGILRPALLVPEGIEQRLDAVQFRAIVAHELCHVRRCDNLLAAIHLVVETLFWFHPLVWWIGTRLVEERERACDESVLCSGGDPEIYAMGILLTCRFYLESPMTCMAGVTGGNLKRRVELIMTQAVGEKLTAGRKALLAAAAMATIVTPAAIGFLNAPFSYAQAQADGTGPGYEVASIKPSKPGVTERSINADDNGRLTTENTTLKDLMRVAYGVRDFQIVGGPAWFDKDTYDIVAKPAGKSGPRDFGPNIQKLLADRFELQIHRETKETRVYDLIIAKGGPKLKEVSSDPRRGIRSRPGLATGMGASMVNLSRYLSQLLGSQVNDKTGLSGEYDFKIEYAPDEGPANKAPGDGRLTGTADSVGGPSIFTAVQEQLGLRLTTAKGRVEVIVIDHAEKPSEN